MGRSWKGNKEEFITDYNKGLSFDQLNKKHKISVTGIYCIIKSEKLKTRVKGKDWENIKKISIDLYKSGIGITKISQKFKANPLTIRNFITDAGYTIKTGWDYVYKTEKDHNYFEKIDSTDKAYFLGLLYADGNIYPPRKKIQITLQNEDSYILEKFKNCIGYTGKFYSDRNKYTKMMIESEKMMNDLIKLNCVPRKSLILEFPTEEQVPREFIWHFIRGYFDGDGCIKLCKKGYPSIDLTSTGKFLEHLKSILFNYGIETSNFCKRYKHKEVSAGSITIKRKDTKKFIEFMYKDSEEIRLFRKYDKCIIANYYDKFQIENQHR